MIRRKFCIITTARCGSNALVSLLRLVPDTICHGELFNQSGIWTAMQPRLDLPHSKDDRDRDPVGFLRDIEEETFKHAATFGFKLFLAHSPAVRAHVIASEDYRIVLLSRTNRLAQFASLAVARASGVWHSRRRPGQVTLPTIVFDKGEFEKFVRGVDRRYEAVKSEVDAQGRPWFALEYRDIQNAQMIDALGAFLGLDGDGLSTQIPSIPHVKQGPSAIVNRFSNPDDVLAAMHELGHEAWLNEGDQQPHV